MKKYGLMCNVRKANPNRRMANAIKTNNVADNLVNREFEKYGPRKILLTDITYIPFEGRFCYLSTIIDAFTKEILSYVLSESLEVVCSGNSPSDDRKAWSISYNRNHHT